MRVRVRQAISSVAVLATTTAVTSAFALALEALAAAQVVQVPDASGKRVVECVSCPTTTPPSRRDSPTPSEPAGPTSTERMWSSLMSFAIQNAMNAAAESAATEPAAAAGPTAAQRKARELNEIGVAAWNRGSYAEAARHFGQALKSDPKDATIRDNLRRALDAQAAHEQQVAVGLFRLGEDLRDRYAVRSQIDFRTASGTRNTPPSQPLQFSRGTAPQGPPSGSQQPLTFTSGAAPPPQTGTPLEFRTGSGSQQLDQAARHANTATGAATAESASDQARRPFDTSGTGSASIAFEVDVRSRPVVSPDVSADAAPGIVAERAASPFVITAADLFFDPQHGRTADSAINAVPETPRDTGADGATRRVTFNGLVGGTGWIYGLHVPPDSSDARRVESYAKFEDQIRVAGLEPSQQQTMRQLAHEYNFIIGVAASHSEPQDLLARVGRGDEFSCGSFSAEHAPLFNNLRDRRFDRLDCHSNGAMLCVRALTDSSMGTRATHVRLFGPQITRPCLDEWNALLDNGTIETLDIYINRGDPIPAASYAGGTIPATVTAPAVVLGAFAMNEVEQGIRQYVPRARLFIVEHCPELRNLATLRPFSNAADVFGFSCHGMDRYLAVVSEPPR